MGFGNQSYTIKDETVIIDESERELIINGENPGGRSLKELEAVRSGKRPADNFISKDFGCSSSSGELQIFQENSSHILVAFSTYGH